MHIMLRTRQPAEVEQHAVRRAGLHQLSQAGVVVQHRTPHCAIACRCQPRVCVINGLLLNIQPQHVPCRASQRTQELRVVAVAAGGIHVQPAGGEPCGQKRMAELHGGQVGHAAAHQLAAVRGKAIFLRQRPARVIPGQGSGEPRGLLWVQSAVLAQKLFQQITAVAAPAPPGHDLQPQDGRAVHDGCADGLVFLI